MLHDSVAKNHVNLVCRNRSECRARGKIAIVGRALDVVKENGAYKLQGDREDLMSTDNYGDTLCHEHTRRCKGEIS